MVTKTNIVFLCIAVSSFSISRAQPVYDIGSRRQVFIDGQFLQNAKGIYHMWYTVCEETDDVNVLLRRIAYARSTDGRTVSLGLQSCRIRKKTPDFFLPGRHPLETNPSKCHGVSQ
jgi:hypothetical protein